MNPLVLKIQQELRETRALMHANLVRIGERGQTTDQLEKKADDLEQTSFLFVVQVLPWYRSLYERTRRLLGCCVWPAYRTCKNCCSRGTEEKRKKLLDE